jgi:hypothetical protein
MCTSESFLVLLHLLLMYVLRIGEDTLLMGVLEPVQPNTNTASVWLRMDGTVMYTCSTFEDMLAYSGKDLLGTQFTNLAINGSRTLQE